MAVVGTGGGIEARSGALGALRAWAMRLWRGEEPLGIAFWHWSIALGLILNVTFTFALYGALSAGAPGIVLVLIRLLPWPYFLLTGIGVWRAANRHPGSAFWATIARAAAIVWTILECLV